MAIRKDQKDFSEFCNHWHAVANQNEQNRKRGIPEKPLPQTYKDVPALNQ